MDESHVAASRDRGSGSIREVKRRGAATHRQQKPAKKKPGCSFVAGLYSDHNAAISP
jgi:hypothetical protein